ncbi:unnamed protein product [Tilletia controversa]|uniref:Uncharacterized protein n=3 Tax=Tilletia TaxID=13289 RepID=A0A8X7MN92_9BASI|nr:hypothetical protein CF336_g6387 [Tilletia laevis]KAE8191210.1 hypothetical protein CF328_g5748 [Tilletia controversa]KAE8261592.1 hypothetical protein A4X03_0g3122 [Tilletia caries]KAE8192962.1 hypothetical protein CF335_g5711 [Tilletia laevis]KAE8242934.1 hypothetical protein A4X06_0g6669 [Tilletia controversa]
MARSNNSGGGAPSLSNNAAAAAFLSQIWDGPVQLHAWGGEFPPPNGNVNAAAAAAAVRRAGAAAAAAATTTAGPAPPPPPSATSNVSPPCTCGQHHDIPTTKDYQFLSSGVMKATLTSGLVIHVRNELVDGDVQLVLDPIGYEDPITKKLDTKSERPERATMTCSKDFIEHLTSTQQLNTFIEFGSGFFPPPSKTKTKATKQAASKPSTTASNGDTSKSSASTATASTTKAAPATTGTVKATAPTATATIPAAAAPASIASTSAVPATTKTTSTINTMGAKAIASAATTAAAAAKAKEAAMNNASASSSASNKHPILLPGLSASKQPESISRPTSSSSSSTGTATPATTPGPKSTSVSQSAPTAAVSFSPASFAALARVNAVWKPQHMASSPGQKETVSQSADLITAKAAEPSSVHALPLVAKQQEESTMVTVTPQNMDDADFDLSLDLDESVIAAVTLAYEASDRGVLQTALKCLDVGRSLLGPAEHRGRRSLQAWQDDDQMLKDAEAHIRARSIAQMTVRQLEDLMSLSLNGALDAGNNKLENPMLKGLIKALTVLQDEIGGTGATPEDGASPAGAVAADRPTPNADPAASAEQAASKAMQKSVSYFSEASAIPAKASPKSSSAASPSSATPPVSAQQQPAQARQTPVLPQPSSSKAAKTPNSWVHELTQQLQVNVDESAEKDVLETGQSDPTQAASAQAREPTQGESTVSTTDFLKTRSQAVDTSSTPSPALGVASQAASRIDAPRIDDDDAFDANSPMRFTDADFFADTNDALQDAKALYAKDAANASSATMTATLSSGSSGSNPAVSPSPERADAPDSKAASGSELVSIPAPFKELQLAVQNKLPLVGASTEKVNNRSLTMPWAIWIPPVEEDLQRVGVWASTSVAPKWSSTINQDGELGYIPNFIGEEGKLWFGEAMSRGLLLARMSVKLPNAYAQPGYMETLIRQTDRASRAKVSWLALRGAPGTFAPPRVLDQFLADAKRLESIQLFILPEAEKRSGGGGAAGGDGSSGIARLPSNLLSAPTALRRLAIVSPLIRTDFYFDLSSSALEGLSKLQHLTLVLDEASDIDVDWVKSVLKLCSGTLETLQLSGALTTGLSQTEGSSRSESTEEDDEESDDEGGDEGEKDSDEDDESDEERDAESESDGGTLSSGQYGGASTERSRSGHGHGSGQATSATTEADQKRPMSKLRRLALEDTASWGSAAQDLFESMHAPVLENLVLAGPRLDRELFCFNITSVSLWPAPGANAHLPAHMSLSRPKQWITRMLMHLESVVHLELGVTQRGMGISRGVDTNEIVEGIEQVIADLEKDMLVLEAESGEAPPQPLGRPLLGTLRSLTIHHLPFDGVSLGRTVMARERMGAASSGNAGLSPAAMTLSDYWDDYGYDDDERPAVGQAVALEKVRLVKCEKVTEAMRKLLGKHVADFSME